MPNGLMCKVPLQTAGERRKRLRSSIIATFLSLLMHANKCGGLRAKRSARSGYTDLFVATPLRTHAILYPRSFKRRTRCPPKKKQEKKISPDEFRRRLVCAGLNVTFRRDLLDVRCDVVVFITLVFKPLQHSLLRQTRTCSEQDM